MERCDAKECRKNFYFIHALSSLQALRLFPLPDVLILADRFDAYNLTYEVSEWVVWVNEREKYTDLQACGTYSGRVSFNRYPRFTIYMYFLSMSLRSVQHSIRGLLRSTRGRSWFTGPAALGRPTLTMSTV